MDVIGQIVCGKIDRPVGSAHPKYPDMVYPVNYGCVEGVFAGDGEEQDVYVLGTEQPIGEFCGTVIAVYHRTDDTEDKWIVSPDGRDYTDEEILEKIRFQEQYFDGYLIRQNRIEEDAMKIGLASYEFKNGNVAFNLSQIEKAMAQVKGTVDLLCFGESFLQGFDALTWQYDRDRAVAVTPDSPVMRHLKALTVRYGVDILFGYTERDGECLYSSCALLAGGALLHNYRRISRGWKEYDLTDEHYCEGTSTEPFLYKGRTVQIALCGDLWDCPERFVTDGLLIWPVYMSFDSKEWPTFVQEYAAQAKLAARETLMVNSITRDFPAFGGAFRFVDGEVAEELDFGREDILIVEV